MRLLATLVCFASSIGLLGSFSSYFQPQLSGSADPIKSNLLIDPLERSFTNNLASKSYEELLECDSQFQLRIAELEQMETNFNEQIINLQNQLVSQENWRATHKLQSEITRVQKQEAEESNARYAKFSAIQRAMDEKWNSGKLKQQIEAKAKAESLRIVESEKLRIKRQLDFSKGDSPSLESQIKRIELATKVSEKYRKERESRLWEECSARYSEVMEDLEVLGLESLALQERFESSHRKLLELTSDDPKHDYKSIGEQIAALKEKSQASSVKLAGLKAFRKANVALLATKKQAIDAQMVFNLQQPKTLNAHDATSLIATAHSVGFYRPNTAITLAALASNSAQPPEMNRSPILEPSSGYKPNITKGYSPRTNHSLPSNVDPKSVKVVRGHYRSNGTYVEPYLRTRANSTVTDNIQYGRTRGY